jgi:serine/threonine protein phosphatase PrpC
MAPYLRYSAFSHRGYRRDNNEDSVYAGRRLLALADGMGGHAAGEIASSLVIAELAALDDRGPGDDLLAELHDAAARANETLARYVDEHPAASGMGTTLTAMLFAGDRFGLVHVGDSRAYLLRDRRLTQMTKDETYIQSLIDEGRLSAEEAAIHPQRSIVMRALSGRPLEPALEMREAKVGDRYLICSDGVSDVLSAETIAHALLVDDPQRCAYALLQTAMREGTQDNVTCIVADVTDRDLGYNIPIMDGAAHDLSAPL